MFCYLLTCFQVDMPSLIHLCKIFVNDVYIKLQIDIHDKVITIHGNIDWAKDIFFVNNGQIKYRMFQSYVLI